MRPLVLVLVLLLICVFTVAQHRGNLRATLHRAGGTGSVLSAFRRGTPEEFLMEETNPCLSLRENEEQRLLLCNRSKFNFNPFGLRFGKRYIYRRAVKTARTHNFSPLSLLSRELEVAT